MSSEKLNSIISEKRIKLHLFKPSNREIWTVVGMEKEYWLDPGLDFCSCFGYYFSNVDEKNVCYHLKSLKIAMEQDGVELITFSDYEYEDFISSLLHQL